jgi:hypothetical protein
MIRFAVLGLNCEPLKTVGLFTFFGDAGLRGRRSRMCCGQALYLGGLWPFSLHKAHGKAQLIIASKTPRLKDLL